MTTNSHNKLWRDSYLDTIRGSVGSNAYRHFYTDIDEDYVDVLKDGMLSCAYFVSSVLSSFSLIERIHTTTKSTVKDIVRSGWTEVGERDVQTGDVIVWVLETYSDTEANKHIGFYMGEGKAISNSEKNRTPSEHDWKFRTSDGSSRGIEAIYTFNAWDKLHRAFLDT